MFEDFKEKISEKEQESEKVNSAKYSPEVLMKLEQRGIDPENVTLEQLFPECLDHDGCDLSLMSGAEWDIMVAYAKTRKYLLETYPQTQQEAKMLGRVWTEDPQAPYQI